MTVVAWVLALLTAAIHLAVFVFEAFLIERPAIHRGVFHVPTSDVPAVRLWAFGVGFYNALPISRLTTISFTAADAG